MAVREIEKLGSSVLREPADEVDAIDDDLKLLIREMFETMHNAEGIGLAGPQVGVSRRVIVVDVSESGRPPFVLVNPRILETARETEKAEEGCLSIPGVSGVVERSSRVVVEGLDQSGEAVRIEADGLLARCLQHEIDHLDGVLFIDRLSPFKRNMILKKYKSLQSEEKGGKGRDRAAVTRNG